MSTPPPPPPGDYPPPPGDSPPPPPPPGNYPPPSGPAGGPGGGPPYQYSGQGPTPTNALAIASLILGLLALPAIITIIFGVILGLAAIVTGALGVQRAPQLQGSGRGLAIAGIVTGVIAVLLSVLLVVGVFAIGSNISDLEGGSINIDGTEFEFPTE